MGWRRPKSVLSEGKGRRGASRCEWRGGGAAWGRPARRGGGGGRGGREGGGGGGARRRARPAAGSGAPARRFRRRRDRRGRAAVPCRTPLRRGAGRPRGGQVPGADRGGDPGAGSAARPPPPVHGRRPDGGRL